MDERPPIAAATAGGGDRISALPDAIVHNILYRLDAPKQAARTSSLSRRWLDLWRSYPVLEFRDEELENSAERLNSFAGFAAASAVRLSLYHEDRFTLLDSFKLSLAKIRQSCPQIVAEGFAMLLASALGANGGSPLEIVVRSGWRHEFPEGLLSNCSRTKVLKLQGCDLNGVGSVSLQNLQVLHLDDVQITEQFLYGVVGNAPNLESLSLTWLGIEGLVVSASNFPKLKTLIIQTRAYGSGSEFDLQLTEAPCLQRLVFTEVGKQCKLRTVSLFSAPKLTFLRIKSYYRGVVARPDLNDFVTKLPSLQVLEIYPVGLGCDPQMEFQLTSAPCLKTLKFRGDKGICNLNMESRFAAPNLKVLKLTVLVGFKQNHLDDLISNLPCLESLSLEFNDGSSRKMSKIRICSPRLRGFELRDCSRGKEETLQELEIDAPNLVSAHFSGSRFRSPGKINVVNVSPDCRFVVEGYDAPASKCEWFLGLRKSLSSLSPFPLILRLHGLDLFRQMLVVTSSRY
ncbi:unnamed protein product [Linum tenue]|uniref:F-box domain-containing protein n=1 Tax=Linum tenue TaxID=586396 RepID=A0AAV0QF47_9ROSI|nr:unnamed protein product [Linum tenue]